MNKIYIPAIMAATIMSFSSCEDLDQYPHVETSAEAVYTSVANYESVLAKCYALFVTTGQQTSGSSDLSSNNGQGYIRNYFNLQESPTDELFNTWTSGDQTKDITYMTWDASDSWVEDCYQRIYYNITLYNEFLRHCTDGEISGFNADEQATLRQFRGEARFLRALCYSHILDLYRQGPMVTDADEVGAYIPQVADKKTLFAYIESELKACADEMAATPTYGHAPQAAAWALLAKLYLNAEVWNDEARYTDCVTYCKKVIDSNLYSLNDSYAELFNASNNLRTNEIIFPLVVDATYDMTWGATTYLVCGQVASDHADDGYSSAMWGVTSGWGMFRVCGEFFDKFEATIDDSQPEGYTSNDTRCKFWCKSQSKSVNINNTEDQSAGYLCCKWSNLYDDGTTASNTANYGASIDYPMIRLAEVYLTLAEAVLRGGNGSSTAEALNLFNQIRRRAYGDDNHGYASITLDDVLDERARELYWECSRRTDLVRYNYLTTNTYLWDSKGGVAGGKAVESKYNYYPIPANELTANPNLSNAEY
ncbi:MAG: RagB/SusD family nutrient uptake outer membrane protein [Bacteroidales bacterium]|nr:RagB/SusD family nutrient uptake outer membrane protein [Bacteroidales bacterium]